MRVVVMRRLIAPGDARTSRGLGDLQHGRQLPPMLAYGRVGGLVWENVV